MQSRGRCSGRVVDPKGLFREAGRRESKRRCCTSGNVAASGAFGESVTDDGTSSP